MRNATKGAAVTVKYVYTRRSAVVQSLGPRPSPMTRMPIYMLATLIAAAPLSAAAQDRGDRGRDRDRDRERERPSAERQDERPRDLLTAATATPRLPTRPLMPMVKPGRVAVCTSIGMPTGW